MAYLLSKRYTNFAGLDLKSHDLIRNDNYSSDMKNCQNDKDGNLEKRKGYQACSKSVGGFGLAVYNRIDPTTGIETEEMLSVSNVLNRSSEATFTITYSGSSSIAYLSFFYDTVTSEYRLQITEGLVQVLDYGAGKGFDEGTIRTLFDLKSAVDAVTDFSATIVGDSSQPAAFIPITPNYDFSSGAFSTTVKYWEEVNHTFSASGPFAGSETNKTSEDFENVSSAQLSNLIFFSNGYDNLVKYDGQTAYRAGLPAPPKPSLALTAGAALDATAEVTDPDIWLYQLRYTQFDNAGNIVDGQPSEEETLSVAHASQPTDVDVTVTNIEDGTGFNTNCAIVAGAQGPVNTIVVDDGSGGAHTMKAGDTAYFFDSVSAAYVEREVTSVVLGSITVAGAAVTVADNAVISNNLRIGVYRSEANGTFKFLSAEIPNNSFTTTQVYTDSVTDALLGIQLIEPLVNRGLPPKGRYVATFNSQLVIAGDITSPNLFYWSDATGPEFFPTGINALRSDTHGDEKITGIGQSNEVFAVFKRKSIDIISGDISTNNIRRDVLTTDIGCEAHHSIAEVRGKLYFLSDRGVYSLQSGQIPVQESTVLEPVFDQKGIDESFRFNMKRAIGINHREEEQYILYLPKEFITGGDLASRDDSNLYVEDYFRKAWYKWDNMNMAGGAVIHNNRLNFQERRRSLFTGTVDHITYIQGTGESFYDYQDNTNHTEWEYRTNWYHEGEPSIFKHWILLKMFALPKNNENSFVVDVTGDVNFIDDLIRFNFSVDFSTLGAGYGVSAYGTTPYGNPADFSFKHKINSKSRAMRLIFSNSQPQKNVNLTGWELEVAVPFRPEIKE